MGDDTLEATLLPGCAARIDINGMPNGSGFFVTPKDVITCGHVLYEGAIQVFAVGRTHKVSSPPVLDDQSDLAWIKLDAADTAVPVALLGEVLAPGDALYAFGYPEGKNGEPALYLAEGLTKDNPPRIKFKQGQVKRGMSGSPLLNMRTGAVCGVLMTSSGLDSDLGGYGATATALLASERFRELRAKNQAAQASDPRWVGALTADQQKLSVPGPLASRREAIGLVIDVGQKPESWCVSASWLPDGQPIGAELVDLNVVRSRVARLFRAWRSHSRIRDVDQARILGEVLYRSIFPPQLAADFQRRLAEGTPVDISLHFTGDVDTDLMYLPWEQLHTPASAISRQIPLGFDPKVTLARVLTTEPESSHAPSADGLRVLLAGAPPFRDQPSPRCEDLREDILGLKNIAHLSVSDGRSPEPAMLRKDLSNGYDVLHYVGYGKFSATDDEIALSDGYGGILDVSPDDFADCVADSPPGLVVLQTCQGPGNIPADVTELALPLIRAGVHSVVVFQYPLSARDLAQKFNRTFYQLLMTGSSVRHAVQQARNEMSMSRWDLPALFEMQPGNFSLVSDQRQPGGLPEDPL